MPNKLIEIAVRTTQWAIGLLATGDAATARTYLGVSSGGGGGAVDSVNGKTGAVTLAPADIGAATAAQGAKADTALQPGEAPGNITSVNGKTGVVTLNAADVGAVATGTLSAVASSGSYSDLSNKPTLGTAAAAATTDFATAAQGTKADTATQPNAPSFTESLLVNRNNAAGVEATLRTTAQNAPVIHYEYRNQDTSDGRPLANQLLGAAGARPWAGTDWTAHSAAAYHFGAAENHTATAQGTFINLSITPYGLTMDARYPCATFNADGDVINSKGLTMRMVNAGERGRGIQILRQANAEISIASFSNAAYVSFYRGIVAGGTPTAPTATASGAGLGFGLIGYDGTQYTGAKGIVGILAAEAWTATANGTTITFETTPKGSLSRVRQGAILPEGGLSLTNVSVVPATPAGGGVLYVEAGALKYKGSSGTVTTLGPA